MLLQFKRRHKASEVTFSIFCGTHGEEMHPAKITVQVPETDKNRAIAMAMHHIETRISNFISFTSENFAL